MSHCLWLPNRKWQQAAELILSDLPQGLLLPSVEVKAALDHLLLLLSRTWSLVVKKKTLSATPLKQTNKYTLTYTHTLVKSLTVFCACRLCDRQLIESKAAFSLFFFLSLVSCPAHSGCRLCHWLSFSLNLWSICIFNEANVTRPFEE